MRQTAMRSERRADWSPPVQLAAPVLEFEPRRRDLAGWCLLRFVAAARGVRPASCCPPIAARRMWRRPGSSPCT